MSDKNTSSGGGLSLVTLAGAALAGFSSYSLGNAPGWIAIHAVFNWLYILYLCAGCGGGLPTGIF
jgi:hypothetical protein